MLFKILYATYSFSSLTGSEVLVMLKKLYNLQDENDIWTQFIHSKQGAYAPGTVTTVRDSNRPGHSGKIMKRGSVPLTIPESPNVPNMRIV